MAARASQDERIASMTLASVYPHYVAKLEKKGRGVVLIETLSSLVPDQDGPFRAG